MGTRASRFWFLVLVVAADIAFMAAVGFWAPRSFLSGEDSELIERYLDYEKADDVAERYRKAFSLLHAVDAKAAKNSESDLSEFWYELRTDREPAEGLREDLASIARRAEAFENSLTDADRATIKSNSLRSLSSQLGIFSSFPKECAPEDFERLQAKYPPADLFAKARSVRSLALNEEWNDDYLQRQALRQVLEADPRFEKDRDLARTFYDEDVLKEMKSLFPPDEEFESIGEAQGNLLRAGVSVSEIRKFVTEMISVAPSCFTVFDSIERYNDEDSSHE